MKKKNDFPIVCSELTDNEFMNLLQIGDKVNISFKYGINQNNLDAKVIFKKIESTELKYLWI